MFRFTIRELLLLTLVAGMALAWALRENQLRQELLQALRESRLWQARTEAIIERIRPGYNVEWTEHSITVARDMGDSGRATTTSTD